MNESWKGYTVTLICGDQKYSVNITHYQVTGDVNREWYRIYGEGFRIQQASSEQAFGFGRNAMLAGESFIMSLYKFKPQWWCKEEKYPGVRYLHGMLER